MTTQTINQEIEDIHKGCGKEISGKDYVCGKGYLCKGCASKLSKMFKEREMIKDIPEKRMNKRGQSYLPLALFIIVFLTACLIFYNQIIIINNDRCISIKFSEGENDNFCKCVELSKKLNFESELEEDYDNILNKFCGGISK